MIYDKLENGGRYFEPGGPFARALSFAVGFDASGADGRYEIESEDLFALVSSYDTAPAWRKTFELHRRYADVQVVIEGEEKMEVSPAGNLKMACDYDQTKDVGFIESPEDSAGLVMRPGYFAVIHPEEAHRPNCDLHGTSRVRKIVVKVRMQLRSENIGGE